MTTLKSLGIEVESSLIPLEAHEYVQSFPKPIGLNELHRLIDAAWDDILKKHHGQLNDLFLSEFYSHPVWSLNSIFSESDPQSLQHRHALAHTIQELGLSSVADIGGGSGTFLRLLKAKNSTIQCILCEPYLQPGIIGALQAKGIDWAPHPPESTEGLTLIDVLEHLPDPLGFMKEIISNAKDGTYFFFGNCFYPVIKCHLPETFFLRRTFCLAAKCMGLRMVGRVANAEYIEIYRLEKPLGGDPFLESMKLFLQSASQMAEVLHMIQ